MAAGDDASTTPQSMDASTFAAMEQDHSASTRPPFVILGIDGGATSTSCVAMDVSLLPSPVTSPSSSSSPPFVAISRDVAMRAVIGRGTAGSSNRNSVGGEWPAAPQLEHFEESYGLWREALGPKRCASCIRQTG